eukprot:1162694-Pleurochrysis_carterae.AAC.1
MILALELPCSEESAFPLAWLISAFWLETDARKESAGRACLRCEKSWCAACGACSTRNCTQQTSAGSQKSALIVVEGRMFFLPHAKERSPLRKQNTINTIAQSECVLSDNVSRSGDK